MVSTNNLKNGMTLLLDDRLWQVVENAHHKPGKGQAVVRTKLKAVESGKVVERTFRAGEDVEQAIVERKTLQFLYKDGDAYVLMDTESYDQRHVQPEVIGDNAKWVQEGDELQIQEYDGDIIGVEVPASVELEVTHTEPGLAGDTATNTFKPATLETGVEVQVPLFIAIGEKIKVDTRSGDYISPRLMADEAAARPRPGTRDPHRSRQRALKILFQADLRKQSLGLVLQQVVADPAAVAMLDDVDAEDPLPADTLDAYAIRLVEGVAGVVGDLDQVIGRFARNWTVDRMPLVDRNILRLGAYELLHEDTSAAVVIDEALELAKDLSTDDSRRFVNGILESVRKWDDEGRPVLA